jgi:arabinose-5-phosphate isomerase
VLVDADILAADALRIMQHKKINALLVTDEHKCLTGVLNMHDLLRSGAF